MVCKVIWTPNALKTYIANIGYLEKDWTEKEVKRFITDTEKKIQNIAGQPLIGSSRSAKYPNIRFTLIHKRVALIYRYKPVKNEIELLRFWNTWQNPRKQSSTG